MSRLAEALSAMSLEVGRKIDQREAAEEAEDWAQPESAANHVSSLVP